MPDCACAMQIGHRILRKRIHVRIEHVAPSRCREEFLVRQKKNDQIKHEAKERGGEQPASFFNRKDCIDKLGLLTMSLPREAVSGKQSLTSRTLVLWQ